MGTTLTNPSWNQSGTNRPDAKKPLPANTVRSFYLNNWGGRVRTYNLLVNRTDTYSQLSRNPCR